MIRRNRAARRRPGTRAGVLALAAVVGSAVLGAVVPGAALARPGAAGSAGAEYPATWVVSGKVATGTMEPSGIVVTATLTGPVAFSKPPPSFADPTGSLLFSGPAPGFFPPTTTQALHMETTTCTGPCGSIIYSFSRPVMAPVFYLGDVGAGSVDAGIFTDFRDTPVTLAAGTFSLHAPGSQTSTVSLTNGGTTIAFTSPGSEVGQPVPVLSSCGTFGCGAYDVHTPAAAVTSVTMNYGYGGTGTSLDLFSQVLAVTPMAAALTLVKSVAPSVEHTAGDMVTYSYLVTNTGNVPLTNVKPADTAFSGTGTPAVLSCPGTTLAPGQQMTCTGTYKLTQADVNAGKVVNTAVATGTPPAGPPVTSAPATATVTIPPNPGITIKKSASPGWFTWPGTVINFTLLVTNTGNVPLTGVTVSDSLPGLSAVSCPAATLMPGQAMTCTASYVTTLADMKAQWIVNIATATGTPPHGPAVVSGPSRVEIPYQCPPSVPGPVGAI